MESGDSRLSHDLEESKQTFTSQDSKSNTNHIPSITVENEPSTDHIPSVTVENEPSSDHIPSITIENEPKNLSETQIKEKIANNSMSQSENEIEDKSKYLQGEECCDTQCESNTKHSNQNEADSFSPAKETQSDGEEDEDDDFESADEGEIDEEELKNQESKMSEEEKEEKRKTSLTFKEEGNILFKRQSYKEAITSYSRALQCCPLAFHKDRSVLFNNRSVCKLKLDRNDEAIKDCSKALELNPDYMKALLRRAELYEKQDKLEDALKDYQQILELDPSLHCARAACLRLPEQINERNEKLKNEMMGKLKDLGNMVLRPFGLSTNNFQLNKDPNSGGYSVNFTQNPPQN